MKAFDNIEDVAQALGDGGPFAPDIHFDTVEQVVDALIELGCTDKVFVYHDDHLGLKRNLSDKFLAAQLSDIENPEFQLDIESVLDQANIIIPFSERELSEYDIAEIREDKISRGETVDD
ncbi:hypothetical protein [Chitinibacter tainanensis]|uniref:hypothetical protein n=1 Tax=Chitinibacter tainanensis TaxID=230667 RepID=UPI00235555BB|nr:hypothetical protein [Chitinibacter tainanensis]